MTDYSRFLPQFQAVWSRHKPRSVPIHKKPLHAAGADQLGMLFINRRVAPEGATMPAPKP